MGLGAKLNFAFIAVILVMVIGHAGYALFTDWKTSRADAEARLKGAVGRLFSKEFSQVIESEKAASAALAHDPDVIQALSANDREALSKIIKAFTDRTGIPGFVSIVNSRREVVFGSDAPAKGPYPMRSGGVEPVLLRGTPWQGPTAFSPTGDVTLTAMCPIDSNGKTIGIAAVSQPLSSEYLTGLVTKFQFLPEGLKNIDLALFSAQEGKITAYTSGLVNTDGGFLGQVNQQGLKAIPNKPVEQAGRLWQPCQLADGQVLIATVLVTTPVPNIVPRITFYAGQVAVAGGVALVLALIFSTAISGGTTRSLQSLKQRAQDLAAQRATLAPLDGLPDDWIELGDLMDSAVTSMRTTIQGLKTQLSQRKFETEEKKEQSDVSSEQILHLNRQLTDKTRQLTEVSKQINFATQQTVLLQQKLDSVLQISTEGYLMLDQYGNVLSANPVFLNWMGVKEGEIAGRLCFDLVKKPGEAAGEMHSQAFAKHSGNPADLISQFYPEGIVHHRYSDKFIEVLAHLHPIVTDDSNIQGWIMVLRDKSLRSEVAQLRTEIVAMLSDSIRGPLTTVEPTWKSILSNAAKTMHPSIGQPLAQLHTHYEQLIGLVDSLLMMYGGIVPPPMIPREQVIVTRLVAECLEEVAAIARDRQLSLDYKTVTGLPNINSDRESLKRVLLQLLEKMILVTAPGGRVRVESQVKGQEMRIGVSSSGPALPQEELDEMFIGFIEGKHDQASYSTRLSMYLARNNIERLGGRIWAESQEGRGTSVYFVLTF